MNRSLLPVVFALLSALSLGMNESEGFIAFFLLFWLTYWILSKILKITFLAKVFNSDVFKLISSIIVFLSFITFNLWSILFTMSLMLPLLIFSRPDDSIIAGTNKEENEVYYKKFTKELPLFNHFRTEKNNDMKFCPYCVAIIPKNLIECPFCKKAIPLDTAIE